MAFSLAHKYISQCPALNQTSNRRGTSYLRSGNS